MAIFIIIVVAVLLLLFFVLRKASAPPTPQQQDHVQDIATQLQTINNQHQQIASNNAKLAELTKQIADAQSELDRIARYTSTYSDNLYQSAKQIADEKIENYYRTEVEIMEDVYAQRQQELQEELDLLIDNYETQTSCAATALDNIHNELEEWTLKQQAINEEILRREQMEKEQEKYHLMLSEADQEDINYLLELAKKFNKKSTLGKFIWSEYILPAFNKMTKLQFGGKSTKNVIYMITINDKHYIGKTKQEATARWTSHLKTALGIEGTLTQDIHKELVHHLADASFQVLEKNIPEAELGAREKFYISQYQSDKYGYNMTAGG